LRKHRRQACKKSHTVCTLKLGQGNPILKTWVRLLKVSNRKYSGV
jgi:hypothetical protein